MLKPHWLFLYRICALLAVFVSSLLFIHYLNPVDSGFCAHGGGCETVRNSVAGLQLGPYVNVPSLGVLAYGALFVLSLFPPEGRAFDWLRWASVFGGVTALILVVTQAVVIQAYCWLCLIVDGLGVATAFVALQMYPLRAQQRQALARWAWSVIGVCAVVLPLLWNWLKPDPAVPQQIRALYQPGKINIVEFADYQCPYCGRLHGVLKGALKEYGDRVHLVRKHMPLVQHEFADDAARAAVCANEQGHGEEMSDALFGGDLTHETGLKYASKLGLDLAAFRDCLKAKRTRDRIDADIQLLESVGFEGLPTTFIGDQKFVGVRPAAVIREIVERAASGSEPASVPTSIFVALSTLLLLGVAFAGRIHGEEPRPGAVKP